MRLPGFTAVAALGNSRRRYYQAVTGAVAGTVGRVLPWTFRRAERVGSVGAAAPLGVGVPPNPEYLPLQVRARQMVLFSIAVMRKPGVIATGRQILAVVATTMTAIASTQVLRGIRATEVVGMLEVPRITVRYSFDLTRQVRIAGCRKACPSVGPNLGLFNPAQVNVHEKDANPRHPALARLRIRKS